MVQVLALQVDLRPAAQGGQALGVVHGAGATDIMLQLVFELGHEGGVAAAGLVRRAQLVERVDQRLGDEHAPVRAEVPALVREVNHLHS